MPVDKVEEQLAVLCEFYKKDKRPDRGARDLLADLIGVKRRVITKWFADQRKNDKDNTSPTQYGLSPQTIADPRRQCIVDYVKNNPLPQCKDVKLHLNNYNEDDDKLEQVISADEILRRHFGTRKPDLLCGARYRALSYIGEGSYGKVLLARDIYSSENVVVKIPLANKVNDNYIRDMLNEFMYQEKAHSLLKGTKCSAPQPKGVIRIINNTVSFGYIYLSVSEYIPIVHDARCTLTIYDAMVTHMRGKPLLKKEEWKDVLLALIDTTERLQENDVYHNDIKSDNVMLYFDDSNKPSPVLIDYGLSSTKKSLKKQLYAHEINVFNDRNAPELFLDLQPSSTSDLYSLARMIEDIGHDLAFPDVKQLAAQYCKEPFRERPKHSQFHTMLDDAFEGRRNYVSHPIELHRAHHVKVKSPTPAPVPTLALAPAPPPVPAPAPVPVLPPPAPKPRARARVDLLTQLAKDDPGEANAAAKFLMENYL